MAADSTDRSAAKGIREPSEWLAIELIRQALGKIARDVATYPPVDHRILEARANEAVTDASAALGALEAGLSGLEQTIRDAAR